MSEIQKQAISWQREYHALTTQLMEMDDKPPMFDTFRDYVEAVEDILSQLDGIEKQLYRYGYTIDKRHMLHIVR